MKAEKRLKFVYVGATIYAVSIIWLMVLRFANEWDTVLTMKQKFQIYWSPSLGIIVATLLMVVPSLLSKNRS